MHKYKKIIILFLISGCSYITTLNGNFVFDDTEAVVKNKNTKNENSLFEIFQNDFWGTPIVSASSHKSYRPLTILSYRLNNYLSSKNNAEPFYYHAINVGLYCLLCVLYLPIFAILLSPCNEGEDFLAALWFTVHPVHVEVVAAIVGRADLLCGIFYGTSFLLYVQSTFDGRSVLFQSTCFVSSLLSAAISMFCKETGISVLGICAVYDLLVSKRNLQRTKLKKILIRLTAVVIWGVACLYLRLWIMNFTKPKFQVMDNPASFHPNFLTRVFTYNYLYFLNILLLLWPHWLCFDWAMGCIPLITTIYDFRILFVLIFWILSVTILYRIFWRNQQDLLLPISFIIISFLPASNILQVGFVLAERTLFLPSVGFASLIVLGIKKLKKHYKNIVTFSLYFILVIFFLKTIKRSNEWINEERLFKSALSVCPSNAKVHYNIAKIAADKGNLTRAEIEYRTAIDLHPKYDQAMNNLANLLRDKGQYLEAEKLLRQAINIRSDFAAAWMNLGIVLATKKQFDEAETSYLTALGYRSNYADCFYNLGNLYLELQRNPEAIKAWRNAIYLRPTHVMSWSNLLVLLDSMNRIDEAIKTGYKALKILPNEPSLHFSIANSLGKAKRWKDAESHFLSAIRFNPGNALYYSNLGVLYHRWNKRNEAENYYRIALKLDPHLKSAQENLLKLRK